MFCFSLKRRAHRRYKYAVHQVRRKEEYLKQRMLAEAMLNDSNCNFWSEVRRFVGHHKSVPALVVDGVSGPENVANLWCSHFKQLYNTVDGSVSIDLLSALDSGISHDELDRTSISAEVIEVAIGKLKRGKSDGDTLMSDHIIKALSSIWLINAETRFYATIFSRCYYSANTQRVQGSILVCKLSWNPSSLSKSGFSTTLCTVVLKTVIN